MEKDKISMIKGMEIYDMRCSRCKKKDKIIKALLEACKAIIEDLQIASETYEVCSSVPGFRQGNPRKPEDMDISLDTQEKVQAAIKLAEEGE